MSEAAIGGGGVSKLQTKFEVLGFFYPSLKNIPSIHGFMDKPQFKKCLFGPLKLPSSPPYKKRITATTTATTGTTAM